MTDAPEEVARTAPARRRSGPCSGGSLAYDGPCQSRICSLCLITHRSMIFSVPLFECKSTKVVPMLSRSDVAVPMSLCRPCPSAARFGAGVPGTDGEGVTVPRGPMSCSTRSSTSRRGGVEGPGVCCLECRSIREEGSNGRLYPAALLLLFDAPREHCGARLVWPASPRFRRVFVRRT